MYANDKLHNTFDPESFVFGNVHVCNSNKLLIK